MERLGGFCCLRFNKSHSTCYALIGFQTAYLKSHYPEEYMAAVLSNNMNDIKQVSFLWKSVEGWVWRFRPMR